MLGVVFPVLLDEARRERLDLLDALWGARPHRDRRTKFVRRQARLHGPAVGALPCVGRASGSSSPRLAHATALRHISCARAPEAHRVWTRHCCCTVGLVLKLNSSDSTNLCRLQSSAKFLRKLLDVLLERRPHRSIGHIHRALACLTDVGIGECTLTIEVGIDRLQKLEIEVFDLIRVIFV